MQPLRPWTKAGIVAGGCVAAVLLACLAVWVRVRLTGGADAPASSGMFAFGDLLLGLAVFAAVAGVPFGLALYWLRPVALFWTLLAAAAVVFALTGPVGVLVSLSPYPDSFVGPVGMLRVWLMPPAALTLGLCGLFAPRGKPRWILIVAGLTEGVIAAAYLFAFFLMPQLSR